MSWGAELSPDYDKRSVIQGGREAALILGMLLVLVLPAIVEQTTEGATQAEKVAPMGWFIILSLPVTVAIAVFFVGEQPQTNGHGGPKRSVREMAGKVFQTFLEIARTVRDNRMIRLVLIADVLASGAPAITGALYLFFAKYVMELPSSANLLLLVYFATGFLGVPLWTRLSHWSGKHKALAFAMIYGALSLPLVVFFPRGEFWFLFAGNSLYGVAFGASSFLLRSIMADVTDYDYLKSGERRTGLYYSLLTMTAKVSGALAVGVTYPILQLIGFVPEIGANSAQTLDYLLYLYVGLPALFMAGAAYVIWSFPLGRAAQEDLRRRIIERDGHGTAGNTLAEAEAAVVQVGSAGSIADRPAD